VAFLRIRLHIVSKSSPLQEVIEEVVVERIPKYLLIEKYKWFEPPGSALGVYL